jgi:hypothetical protein
MFWGGSMILRRYGTRIQAVSPNFDSRAMNEIGFTKDDSFLMDWDEFTKTYQCVDSHELTATAEGDVQTEAEQRTLESLRQQLDQLLAGLKPGAVAFIESEMGKDYPKLREKQTTTVVGTENRLHFARYIEPPLRIGIYEPRTS